MKSYRCPVTGIVIQSPCEVLSCMWNSVDFDHPMNCCYTENITDAILAKAKRINETEVSRLKRQGSVSIASTVMLYEYKKWINTFFKKELVTVESGIKDLPEVELLEGVISEYPYTYSKWHVSEFVTACVKQKYEQFVEDNNTRVLRQSQVLACPAKTLRLGESIFYQLIEN